LGSEFSIPKYAELSPFKKDKKEIEVEMNFCKGEFVIKRQ